MRLLIGTTDKFFSFMRQYGFLMLFWQYLVTPIPGIARLHAKVLQKGPRSLSQHEKYDYEKIVSNQLRNGQTVYYQEDYGNATLLLLFVVRGLIQILMNMLVMIAFVRSTDADIQLYDVVLRYMRESALVHAAAEPHANNRDA